MSRQSLGGSHHPKEGEHLPVGAQCRGCIASHVRCHFSGCRYLLVEFLMAEVLSQTREREQRPRLMSIALALRHHRSFLKRLKLYEIVPSSVAAIMQRMEDGETASPQVCTNTGNLDRRSRTVFFVLLAMQVHAGAPWGEDRAEKGGESSRPAN